MKDKDNNKLKGLIQRVLRVPGSCNVIISEKKIHHHHTTGTAHTDHKKGTSKIVTEVCVEVTPKRTSTLTFNKKAINITEEDILTLKKQIRKEALKQHPLLARLSQLFGWWMIFAGSISFFSVCPICGQAGCAFGIATTGILAGFFAFIKLYLKDFLVSVKKILNRTIRQK